jgi:flagellar basal body-associated protein FliL
MGITLSVEQKLLAEEKVRAKGLVVIIIIIIIVVVVIVVMIIISYHKLLL